MTFRVDEIDTFKEIFNESKEKIRSFPGVQRLELLQDIENENIFFTYSYWESTEDLENYRQSPLFKSVWAKTKPLFDKRAEAWSTQRLHQLK